MTTADALLQQLSVPGRVLALCDETDLTIAATSTMMADIHAWVALVMPSEGYEAMAEAVLQFREAHQLPELHGNEIVNPGSASTWKTISMEDRLKAFEFACDLARSSASDVLYVHIGKDQFDDLIAQHPGAKFKTAKHKPAVKTVFKALLIERFATAGPTFLVFDKDKNNSGPTLEKVKGASHLVGGGILRADSSDVPGIQIADVAGYAAGRYLRRRDAIMEGGTNGFDEIAMQFVGQLAGRFTSML